MLAFMTGATGFIGSCLARRLLADGHQVRVLVRDRARASHLTGPGIEIVDGDVREPETLREGLRGADAFFHLGNVSRWWLADKREYYEVNVHGTRKAMELALELGVRKTVYTGSLAAIRQPSGVMSREDIEHQGDFESHYSRSKHLGERAVLRLAREEGLDVVVLNPGVVIGPGAIKTFDRMMIEFVNGRLDAIPFPDTMAPLVYIDDVVEAHVRALERGRSGERYILVGENIPLRRAFELVGGLTGIEPPQKTISPLVLKALVSLWELRSYFTHKPPKLSFDALRAMQTGAMGDNSKAREELGIRFTPIAEALRSALLWYEEQGMLGKDVRIAAP